MSFESAAASIRAAAMSFPVIKGPARNPGSAELAPSRWRWDRPTLGAFLALLLVYGFLAGALIRTRLPWIDEAWVANPAVNLITTDKLVTTFFEPANPDANQGFAKATYWMPPGWFLIEAVHFRFFGIGLAQQRSLSALFGAGLLLAVYVIILRIFDDRRVALTAAAFTAIDFVFLEHAADGRMDMAAATCVFAAYALYLVLREKSLRGALLASNSALMIAGLIHPIAIVGVVGLTWLGLWLDRNRLRPTHAFWILLPYMMGGGAWGMYIAQDPAAFMAQFFGKTPPPSFNPLTAFARELSLRYRGMFGFDVHWRIVSLPQFVVGVIYGTSAIAALLLAFFSHRRAWKLLAGLWATHALGLVFLISLKADYHFPIIIPFYASLAAAVVGAFPSWKYVLLPVALLALAQLRVVAKRIWLDPLDHYFMPALAEVRRLADAGRLVSASPEFAYPLGFPANVLHDYNFGFFSGRRPDLIVFSDPSKIPRIESNDPSPLARYRQAVVSSDYQLAQAIGPYRLYVPISAPAPRATPAAEPDLTRKAAPIQ